MESDQPKRIVIIGGVAGGMSCATRARRLNEHAEITVIERGEYPSFANCGLPYHIGGEIAERGKLLVQTAERLRAVFNLDVRTLTTATAIDRSAKTVSVKDRRTGEERALPYDALVLATGAAPLRPPIPGIETPGIFTLRNIADMDAIKKAIDARQVREAIVVGGGYIGLEMAEQLVRRGLKVKLVEALPQVMAPLDPEMAALLHEELKANGIELHLGDAVAGFAPVGDGNQIEVALKSGARVAGEIVVMGLGARPEVDLARAAGLELGQLGGIRVDDHLRTSDPSIYAVGDVIEVRDRVSGNWALIPLAGPANRQGRIVADNILGGNSTYKGTQGTAILRLFELAAACTGASEKALKRAGLPYDKVYLHPGSHAGYFPGAQPVAMKLLFDPASGRVLGAQLVGRDGIDKRIDVLATALAAKMTVDDLAELELAYAPPFGSAKDPINLAGMLAQNVRAGLVAQTHWDELASEPAALLVDVREPAEVERGTIPGAQAIPLGQLRARLNELPKDRPLITYCASGQRSYNAARVLLQHGFRVKNLSGAYKTWQAAQK